MALILSSTLVCVWSACFLYYRFSAVLYFWLLCATWKFFFMFNHWVEIPTLFNRHFRFIPSCDCSEISCLCQPRFLIRAAASFSLCHTRTPSVVMRYVSMNASCGHQVSCSYCLRVCKTGCQFALCSFVIVQFGFSCYWCIMQSARCCNYTHVASVDFGVKLDENLVNGTLTHMNPGTGCIRPIPGSL